MEMSEKALRLLGAALNPLATIGEMGLRKMMPPPDEFDQSIFSRYVPPEQSPTGKGEILPETTESALWKRGSPMLPRLLKPETKLSTVTQQRLAEEMMRMVQKAKPENQLKTAQAAQEIITKLPLFGGKSVTGSEIQKIASEAGSKSHKKGEVSGLRLLHGALKNKSIYHGVKSPEGKNTLWQELYAPPKEAKAVRDAMVDRRVAKNVATDAEKMEFNLRKNAEKDPMEAMMETLRLLGKLPPK